MGPQSSSTFGEVSPGRLEAFSDGIFAIAATLLVLEVRVPEGDTPLLGRLLDAWPTYLAYGISFLVIGIMWLNHHGTFVRVRRVDRGLMSLNLLLLGLVAFIPFPTAVLAANITGTGRDPLTAAVFYSTVMAVNALAFALLWLYLGRHRALLAPESEPDAPERAVRRSLAGVVVYLLLIPVAWLSPVAALIGFAVVGLAYLLAERRLGASPQPSAGADGPA